MCLVDTIDGALMMALYTSTSLAKDQIAVLYYSIVLTVVTIIVAMVIGFIQVLSLILNVAEPTGRFWDGVQTAGDNYEVIGECLLFHLLRFVQLPFNKSVSGGSICGSFIVFGGLSVLLYKPWRRRIERHRSLHQQPQLLQEGDDKHVAELPQGDSSSNEIQDASIHRADETRNPDTISKGPRVSTSGAGIV